jgi:hypothetical protein
MARNGKIARLPRPLRDELNLRLDSGSPARELADWLNALPAVQEVLAQFFHSDPINEQNLCNWRRGGFIEWQTRQDFLTHLQTLSEDAGDIAETAGSMTKHAVSLLGIHFALLLSPSSRAPLSSSIPYPSSGSQSKRSDSPSEPSSSSSCSSSSSNAPDKSKTSRARSKSTPSTPISNDQPKTGEPTHSKNLSQSSILNSKHLCDLTRAVVSLRRCELDAARAEFEHSSARGAMPPILAEISASPELTTAPEPSSPPPSEPEIKPNQGKSSLPPAGPPAPLSVFIPALVSDPILRASAFVSGTFRPADRLAV